MGRLGLVPFLLSCLCLLSEQAQARQWQMPLAPRPAPAALSGPKGGNATFEQYLDHKNPSLGTFPQMYWWNTSYWGGPGSPVFIFTPGEEPADQYSGYMTNRTLVGLYAQEMGGATVVLEHRYYGHSSPFSVLDTKNLTYLNLENVVADFVHFAKTAKLPFDTTNSSASNAPNVPWVFIGGSYSGALAAWIDKLSPGTYWAYHATSAPVQAIYNYWSYFLPVQHGMPKNCSADFARISQHVDEVYERGNASEIHHLKDMFGLAKLEHYDDFASVLPGMASGWQSMTRFDNYSRFFQMCDSMEGVRPVNISAASGSNSTNSTVGNRLPPYSIKWPNITVPATGVGLEKALPNLAAWFKYEDLPDTCNSYGYSDWNDTNSIGCFDSYNTSAPIWSDLTVDSNVNRQWMWMLCNEPFAYWQTSGPNITEVPIVPNTLGEDYYQRQCELYFPTEGNATFGSAAGKTTDMLNAVTGGWDFTNTTRLLWVNGEFDPWRSASVSSEIRPGGPLKGTAEAPVIVIPGGIHCDDLLTKNGEYNADVHNVQTVAIAQMKRWVDEFYAAKRIAGRDLEPKS